MIDLRPVGYVIGLLTAVVGAAMTVPMVFDYLHDDREWETFLKSMVLTVISGASMAVACSGNHGSMNIRQAFILTTGVWIALPFFGAVPFMLGETQLRLVDAIFESMSGMTTTGATAIEGLELHSYGIHIWRGVLQWLGGLGIVIVAMIFLPVMKVGGMQFFQSEGFDTLGKALPRALDIAKGLLGVYVVLTAVCMISYIATGMPGIEAFVHAMTTIATGGFSTTDASFAAYPGAPQYVASLFMFLASLPLFRFFQLASGSAQPLFRDVQARGYLTFTLAAILLVLAYRGVTTQSFDETLVRTTIFNVISIFSGTGFGEGDLVGWGPFAFTVLIIVGCIGGCSGSTACSIKVFRFQILFRAIWAQIQRLHSPSRVISVRYDGRAVSGEVMNSIMLLFTCFLMTFGLMIGLLTIIGLSFEAAITGAWTSIFNIGPLWGAELGPTGAVTPLPDAAKWVLIGGMLLGRLEIVSVYVLILPRFWRN